MEQEWKLFEMIAPELTRTVLERYTILRNLYWMQPVGRRLLAEKIGVTERSLRTDTDSLRQHGLLTVTKSGMQLTDAGTKVFHGLENLMDTIAGRNQMEQRLEKFFNIQQCVIVAGNCDTEKKVLAEFGKMVGQLLDNHLPHKDNVIAVMGGTTMASVAENLPALEHDRHNIFVPARGGIGELVNIQANAISSVMAQKSGGSYRALYVPEQVSPETAESLTKEPTIQSVLQLIDQSDAVIYSIGKAMHMAARRKMQAQELSMLKAKNAVAESFGYFFNEQGEVVYKIPRLGLQLEDIQRIPLVIAVAGGKSKGKAVKAYMKNAPHHTRLVTDVACATEILRGATL
ncbi:sugar-binding transcriptional regulator [Enterococcus timonensis]|uniref:sugar-binding transcriptional regulator n=1 Tax=Enterococcus timonensis TaxID=1852364 RepID=UPI0008DB0BA7|nr:sugar-binding domain-containing protein [Enterococcus timonensis]